MALRKDSRIALRIVAGAGALVWGGLTSASSICSRWSSALALGVAGLAVLAAFTSSRLPTWTVGLTAVWLGLESVVHPSLVGSLGEVGGSATAGCGVLLVASVEVAVRRRPVPVTT